MRTLDTVNRVEMQRVLRALKEVVDEAGRGYVYPRAERPQIDGRLGGPPTNCYYVWEGKADCIVARTFEKLGLPLSILRENTGIYGHIDIPLTPEALEILSIAQNIQDSEQTWGKALDGALLHAQTTFGVTL